MTIKADFIVLTIIYYIYGEFIAKVCRNVVTRSHKSKMDRQHNGEKEKGQMDRQHNGEKEKGQMDKQ
jgi:hypothetical protein